MTNRIRLTSVFIALCTLSVVSFAAAVESAKPAPQGHEQDELAYLVGKWKLDGDLDSHPAYANASAKVTGTMDCEWFDGHFAVLCRVEQSSTAAGIPTKALRIIAYSPGAHAYTSYGLTSSESGTQVDLGHFKNGAWTFAGQEKVANGQTIKVRESLTKVSPTSFKLSQERQVGGAWRKLAAATFTKTP